MYSTYTWNSGNCTVNTINSTSIYLFPITLKIDKAIHYDFLYRSVNAIIHAARHLELMQIHVFHHQNAGRKKEKKIWRSWTHCTYAGIWYATFSTAGWKQRWYLFDACPFSAYSQMKFHSGEHRVRTRGTRLRKRCCDLNLCVESSKNIVLI